MNIVQVLENLDRDELNQFVQDRFPHVSRDFSALMSNSEKISLLRKNAYIGITQDEEDARIKKEYDLWLKTRRGARARRGSIALVLFASQGSAPPEARAEAKAIREALEGSTNGSAIDVEEHVVENLNDIRDIVEPCNPKAIHIVIHKGGSASTDKPKDSSQAGRPSYVGRPSRNSAEFAMSLKEVFETLPDEVKKGLMLLTLSGPGSDKHADDLNKFVPHTIGMRGQTSPTAARVFYRAFYKDIGNGRSVETAYERARTALGAYNPAQDDRPIRLMAKNADVDPLWKANGLPPWPRSGLLGVFVVYLIAVYFAASYCLTQFG